ncbi:MAG TPA: ABC transporter ATP-binding protein [Pyrinomonadaceae bacterium]|nr:ABC transporter ATP-binding protein [Pyrinomonadaceae bacterium]
MLVIKDLTKTYSSGVQALQGVSLDLPAGVFGLLGPNGSGKTTLMKIVATLLEPDSGSVEMNGADLITRKDHTRRMLGYLPQDFGLYPTLTAWQMLDYLAKLKGVTNKKERHALIDVLLERVNLSAERSQRLGGFSGGMRQRLGIAQALISEPQLIIVDEPTAGLDPEERLRFHNLISESTTETTVVILSTHIVSDVANLCSHMAIIRKGKIISTCTPGQAVDQLKGSVWEGIVSREQLAAFKSEYNVISSRRLDGGARVRVISKGQRPSEELTEATPVLEDYYFDLINRQDQ